MWIVDGLCDLAKLLQIFFGGEGGGKIPGISYNEIVKDLGKDVGEKE